MDHLEERVANIEADLAFLKEMVMELSSGTKEAFIELYAQIDAELNAIRSSLGIKPEPATTQKIKRK